MTNTLIYIWIAVVLLGLSAVAGLWWAIHSGQFNDLNGHSKMIFDDDEPIGQPTDKFPQKRN